jgi:hypothetical protein
LSNFYSFGHDSEITRWHCGRVLIETAEVLRPIQQQFVPTLLRRDPLPAYDDVANGIISLNCARYGVPFTVAGHIDASATARLRADMAIARGPTRV